MDYETRLAREERIESLLPDRVLYDYYLRHVRSSVGFCCGCRE